MRGLTLYFCPFLALAFFPARALPQQITSAPSGLTATAEGLTLQITALRDDILRVRIWKGDAVPEDASWAVLPQARTSSVPVTSEANGFATKSLRVSVSDHLLLTWPTFKATSCKRTQPRCFGKETASLSASNAASTITSSA
jgi:hypothetical protein